MRNTTCSNTGTLFAYLEQDGAPNNTNRLEGGVNADLKRKLDAHRGLSDEHTRQCCEWVVYMKSADPDPERFVTPECWKKHTTNPQPAHEPAPGMDPSVTAHQRTRHPRNRIRHPKRLGRTLMTRRIRHTFCHLTQKSIAKRFHTLTIRLRDMRYHRISIR